MIREKKEKRLRRNVDVATERTIRQREKRERRERKPGEWEKVRLEFVESAERIDKNKLHEVFNE